MQWGVRNKIVADGDIDCFGKRTNNMLPAAGALGADDFPDSLCANHTATNNHLLRVKPGTGGAINSANSTATSATTMGFICACITNNGVTRSRCSSMLSEADGKVRSELLCAAAVKGPVPHADSERVGTTDKASLVMSFTREMATLTHKLSVDTGCAGDCRKHTCDCERTGNLHRYDQDLLKCGAATSNETLFNAFKLDDSAAGHDREEIISDLTAASPGRETVLHGFNTSANKPAHNPSSAQSQCSIRCGCRKDCCRTSTSPRTTLKTGKHSRSCSTTPIRRPKKEASTGSGQRSSTKEASEPEESHSRADPKKSTASWQEDQTIKGRRTDAQITDGRAPVPRAPNETCRLRRAAFSRSRSLSEKSSSSSCHPSAVVTGDIHAKMPGAGGEDGLVSESHPLSCRVRSFKSTRKGLVRSDDSFRATESTAFKSTGSVRVYRKTPLLGRSESVDSTDSNTSFGGSSVAESYYRVGVVGATKVGKSALIHKFLASEGLAPTGDFECRSFSVTVTVLVDGEESLLEFLDLCTNNEACSPSSLETPYRSSVASCDMTDPNNSKVFSDVTLPPHFLHCDAYTLVFALNDVSSFQDCGRWLRHLREELGIDRIIVLVGNKSDLVRQRKVSNKEACALAHTYDCKYIETSAELGHQTDELLVGTLRQIRLKLSTSHEDVFCEASAKVTSKKRNKWQRLLHVYKYLQGGGASQTTDSCQDFFV